MISFHKFDFKKINLLKFVPLLLMLVVASLSIGFSAYQGEAIVGDIGAVVELQKNMMVTDVIASNPVLDSLSYWEEHTQDSISSSLYLPNEDSTMTYVVTFKNFGNVEAGITAINGLSSNLTYSIKDYALDHVLCDDNDSTKCKLGSTTTLEITIGYAPGQYDSSNLTTVFEMEFVFGYVEYIARVGDNYYSKLQDAINAVPANNTETTVILLKNTSEIITVAKNKNIVFDLQNNTLSNDGNNPVIANDGTIKISNGTIFSDAEKNGAINNQSTGTITISGGKVIAVGGRQALYNNKGKAIISGDAYLSATTTERAAVQNLGSSTMTILGGTIISTGAQAVNNSGTLTIGVKDGNVSVTSPVIQGVSTGIIATANFSFYDGIIKYKTKAIDTAKLVEVEERCSFFTSSEVVDGETYQTSFLDMSYLVTFNANGGSVSEEERGVRLGDKVGALPVTTKSGYTFLGWYTQADGGEEITQNTIVSGDITFYAHWDKIGEVVQLVSSGTIYDTIQQAINASSNNVESEIVLLKNTNEVFTVAASKKIRLNLNGKKINNTANKAIIEDNGTLEVFNGTLTSNADTAIINQKSGSLKISSGEYVATGTRQVIYITGGTVEITGTAYLSSETSGTPGDTTMERGTVQNLATGTLVVTGGTIVGKQQQAISNEGVLTIGVKDGNIDATTSVLIGKIHGLKTAGTFNFYDGIIRGESDAIDGEINNREDDSTLNDSDEQLDGVTYKTAYLS